ncbi:MAG: hypothetical protein QM764_00720 [Chitinophagaceae bacterium]
MNLFFTSGNFPLLSLSYLKMPKYQVTIKFEMDEEFSGLIPAHRTYVNYLINNNVIEHYAVSMETQRVWITMHGESKKEINKVLSKSPIFKYWTLEIDELFVLDGQHYRLPAVQPN